MSSLGLGEPSAIHFGVMLLYIIYHTKGKKEKGGLIRCIYTEAEKKEEGHG